MLLNLFILTSYSFVILISTLGYGLVFNSIIFSKNTINNAAVGFFGLFFLYFISATTHLFTSHNSIHNIIILLIGLIFFYLQKKNIKKSELNTIFTFFILLFSGFILAKTNEDFPYYHLPLSLHFVEQKLQFGTGNLNIAYNHFSSLFQLNSIFYLPITKIYLFNLTNFLFQIFFFSGIVIIINQKKIPNFSKVFIILIFVIYITKFNRLSEYGADYVGQLLVIFSILLCSIIYFDSKKLDNIFISNIFNISLFLVLLASTTKILYVIYFLPLIIIYINYLGFKNFFNHVFNRKLFFIALLSLFSIIFFNFTSSGCLIYPISKTCFYDQFSWTLEMDTIIHMRSHYDAWAKSGIGAGYVVDNLDNFLENFKWVKNWFNTYFFNKISDYIFLVIFIMLLLFIIVFKNLKILKQNIILKKRFFIFYLSVIIILLYWFFNFPTLRYAGYSVVFMFITLPYIYYLSYQLDLSNKKVKTKVKILFLLSIAIFNVRNVDRIYNEFSLNINEHHNFSNFPFFWVENISYKTIDEKLIKLNLIEQNKSCWATPSVCVTVDNLNIQYTKGYIIYTRK